MQASLRNVGAWLRARPFYAITLYALPAVALARIVALRGTWQPDGLPVGWDLTSFLTGARVLASVDHRNTYDFDTQRRVALEYFPGKYSPFPFISPPFLGLVLRPLTSLPYGLAFALWSLGGACAAGIAVGVLVGRPSRWTVALLASALPVVYTLLSGQPTLFTFALVALTYQALDQRRLVLAGALTALLLYKPQATLGLLLYFAVRTRGRAWLGFWMGWLSVAVSLVTVGWLASPDASRGYLRLATDVLPHFLATAGFDPAQILSWRAFFNLLLGGRSRTTEALAAVASLVGVVSCLHFWTSRAAWAPASERGAALDYSAAIVLGVFCAPHASIYDWTVLGVPFLLAWSRFPERRDELTGIFAALALTTIMSQPIAEATEHAWPFGLQIALPTLGLLAWLSRGVLEAQRRS